MAVNREVVQIASVAAADPKAITVNTASPDPKAQVVNVIRACSKASTTRGAVSEIIFGWLIEIGGRLEDRLSLKAVDQ